MRRVILGLLSILFFVNHASAQEIRTMPAPDRGYYSSPENQAYTYVVKEDGKAQVWLRTDGVTIPRAGGTYQLTLPDKTNSEVKVWYRDNGCREYKGEICIYYGGNEWYEAGVELRGKELTVTVPARKVAERDEQVPVTLGITFGMDDVTASKWWGREVRIVTAKASQNVSYLSVGVYMPDGVYARDKQQGPSGWGAAMSAIVNRDTVMSEKASLPAGGPSPAMFDYAGGGEIVRSRPNLVPGEEYAFTFMSSTSIWKLYTREIGFAIAWMTAIALVFSLLLKMIVGKKPISWYLGVMVLILLLMVLIGGLWLTYRMSLDGGRYGIGGVSPALMKGNAYDMGSGPSTTTVAEPAVAPDAPVDGAETAK